MRIINGQLAFCYEQYGRSMTNAEWKQIGHMTLWNSIRKWETTGGSKFTTYLYSQVRFEYLNFMFGTVDNETLYIEEIEDYQNSVEPYEHNYGAVDTQELINLLPPRLRAAIIMRFYEQRTLKDIGEKLNCTHEWARKLIENALEILKENEIRASNKQYKRRSA